MARISEHYDLGITQAGLDFVDVELNGDLKAYIDPFALRNQNGVWTKKCVGLMRTFFQELLIALADKDREEMLCLLRPTGESNETRLGESKGLPNGLGVADGLKANNLIDALLESRAAKSGLLADLEDTGFFVPGIGRDGVSDMATAIIRYPLIAYTRHMCEIYNIPTEKIVSRPWWDADQLKWVGDAEIALPTPDSGPLLLVPKSIVRLDPTLNREKYYRNYLRTHLFEEEMPNPASGLLALARDHQGTVSMDDFTAAELKQYFGTSKPDIVRHTARFPKTYQEYKRDQAKEPLSPTTEENFAAKNKNQKRVNYHDLLEAVDSIKPGKAGAHLYHQAVSNLVNAIFEGSLGNLEFERELHEGRKRFDFTLDNIAHTGFFRWLTLNNYPSAIIPFECKNYDSDPKNREYDQLRDRLGKDRGDIGILVCRTLTDKGDALRRCKDVRNDGRGYLLVLDDADLKQMVEDLITSEDPTSGVERHAYPVLERQFKKLIS
jgi:hypothetical protein